MQDHTTTAMRWLVLLLLLRLCYDLGQRRAIQVNALPQLTGSRQGPKTGPRGLRWREWATRAASSYAGAQERMWRNWEEAMFHQR
jgi:hypothetical protein